MPSPTITLSIVKTDLPSRWARLQSLAEALILNATVPRNRLKGQDGETVSEQYENLEAHPQMLAVMLNRHNRP